MAWRRLTRVLHAGGESGQQFNTVLPHHGCFASGGRLRLDSWRRKGSQPSRKSLRKGMPNGKEGHGRGRSRSHMT